MSAIASCRYTGSRNPGTGGFSQRSVNNARLEFCDRDDVDGVFVESLRSGGTLLDGGHGMVTRGYSTFLCLH